jgi:ABC-2 type transport system ATP-binding protein
MSWAIECDRLTRRFGLRVAVDALSLRVAAGEVYALLGPNGAGKTTTVRLLCGLLAPTSGTARVLGHDVRTEGSAVREGVGLLTEAPGLYDRLSPRRTLRFFADLQGVARPAEAVERYLTLLGLEEHADVPAATLSKGMKQKVALARALLHEPRVLFLDEPTAGLDVPTQRLVRELIARLRGEGRTVVLTTHNLDEAERLADRVGLLSSRLVAEGTPGELRGGRGGRQVRVTVERMLPGLTAAAAAVAGVDRVAESGAELVVSVGATEEVTPDLVAALVAAGARILGVTAERPPLEEVYLRVLSAETPEADGTAAAGAPP